MLLVAGWFVGCCGGLRIMLVGWVRLVFGSSRRVFATVGVG